MRYATLGGGKRLQAVSRHRDGAGARPTRRRPGPRRRRDRMRARLFADPRRSAGDGRRRSAARPADGPPRLRRSDRDPRRRRAAGARLRDPGRSRGPTPAPRRAPRSAPGLARAAGLAGMVGGQMLDIAAETADAPLLARGDRAPAGDEDRRAAPVQRRGGRAARRREPGGARGARGLRRARSARRFRSPTTCSTPRATRRRSASAPARTPTAARRRWSRALGIDGARRELAAPRRARRRRRSTRRGSAMRATGCGRPPNSSRRERTEPVPIARAGGAQDPACGVRRSPRPRPLPPAPTR